MVADLAYRSCVRECPSLIEPVRHRQRLAVVGDGEILEARRVCGTCHRLDIGAAVSDVGMAVEIPPDVGAFQETRQTAVVCRRDLAAILAELWRDEEQTERTIDLRLRASRNASLVAYPEKSVIVQFEAPLQCPVPEGDIVWLRPGEVLQRRTAALGRDDSEIGLNPVA